MTGAVEMAKCANLSQEIRYKYIVKINRYNLKGYRDHKLDYGRTKMQARSIMWVLDKIDLTCSTNILPRMQLLTLYYKQCCYSSFYKYHRYVLYSRQDRKVLQQNRVSHKLFLDYCT